MLDVESGSAIGHLNWELGFWIGFANDPLALWREEDGGSVRQSNYLTQRTGGELGGVIGYGQRLQLGISVPIIVSQRYDYDDMALAPEQNAGLGDVRLMPKVQLLHSARQGVDLALVARLILPTASTDSYMGDKGVGFSPVLAVSRSFGAVRVAGNLGYYLRDGGSHFRVSIEDEVLVKLAGGYVFAASGRHPLELDLALTMATTTEDFFSEFNTNQSELLAGGNVQLTSDIKVFAGAGLALASGFSTPDWRALVGSRYSRRTTDRDGDGIIDRTDACPSEAEDRDNFEDRDGCPDLDNDGDEIADVDDGCPNEAEDRDDFEDQNGCPDPDNDGDGLADGRDACPLKAEDIDGFEDENGCPDLDNDGDQIPDSSDQCPNEVEDMDGFSDSDGCPDLDNDGDKLADGEDECPNQAEDIDGFEDENGCPDENNDGDPLVDEKDDCPNVPGPEANGGCEVIELTVVFRRNTDVFLNARRARARIARVAKQIKRGKFRKLRVAGHTSSEGEPEKNRALSDIRARAVMNALIAAGVSAELLEYKGYGEDRLLEPDTTAKGRPIPRARERNRRVNLEVLQR